jgi:hypothetical protein
MKLPARVVMTLYAVLIAPNAFAQAPTRHDGSRDFDFELGMWKTHLTRLVHPLTGSKTWVTYDGTSDVRPVWNARATLVQRGGDGPAGHLEALHLRLDEPASGPWSLEFANAANGSLGQPTVGQFSHGRGEFYDQETYAGRAILVRFDILALTLDTCRFEQSFSADGGKTWELNWVAVDTRASRSAR